MKEGRRGSAAASIKEFLLGRAGSFQGDWFGGGGERGPDRD